MKNQHRNGNAENCKYPKCDDIMPHKLGTPYKDHIFQKSENKMVREDHFSKEENKDNSKTD